MSEKGQRNKVAPILSLLFSFTVLQPDNNSLKTSATLLHAQPNCNCASNSQGRKTTSLSLKFLNRQAIYCTCSSSTSDHLFNVSHSETAQNYSLFQQQSLPPSLLSFWKADSVRSFNSRVIYSQLHMD